MAWKNTTGKAIHLNADKTRVVPEESPEVAWLLVLPDGELSDEEAERYGLTKAQEPAEDKAEEPGDDKGRSVPRRRA